MYSKTAELRSRLVGQGWRYTSSCLIVAKKLLARPSQRALDHRNALPASPRRRSCASSSARWTTPKEDRPRRRADAISGDIVCPVPEQLDLTIVYEPGEEGWVIASIPEVAGVFSQGRTRDEARTNVIDALRLMLSPEPGDTDDRREREALHLTIVA